MSTTSGGPNIVTDGLVLYLDAGNTKSYISGSTIWYDLTKNRYDGTLINNPTYVENNYGGLTFNDSNNYITTNITPQTINIYDNSYTAESVFKPTNLSGDNMIFGNNTQGTRAGWHLGLRNSSFYFGHYASDTSAGTAVINTTYHVCWVYNKGVSSRIWINGVDTGGGLISSFIATNNINLGTGFNTSNTLFGGTIYIIKIYNKVLTQSEILQNYNAVKSRFGLL